ATDSARVRRTRAPRARPRFASAADGFDRHRSDCGDRRRDGAVEDESRTAGSRLLESPGRLAGAPGPRFEKHQIGAARVAAVLALINVEHLVKVAGYPLLVLIVMGEPSGVPLPGETALIAAALLASQ